MTAIQLCDLFLRHSLSTNGALAERWSNASHRLGGLLPKNAILMYDVQQIGRLDCIVGELERDLARLLNGHPQQSPVFALEFCLTLARAWLALSYETFRTIKQRVRARSEFKDRWTDGLDRAFDDLERVRVAELKREIAKGSKIKGQVEMFVPNDKDNTVENYIHGQTVLNSPLALRPTDGSIVWHVFSTQLGHSEELYRRDMSAQLLSEIERM